MKKLIVFLILIFTTLNVYAEWVKVAGNDTADMYVETDSIKRIVNKVTYWEMIDYKSIKIAGGRSYRSLKMKIETKCDTEESRTIYYTAYSENTGLGYVISSFPDSNLIYTPIVPDSIENTVFKFVCIKK